MEAGDSGFLVKTTEPFSPTSSLTQTAVKGLAVAESFNQISTPDTLTNQRRYDKLSQSQEFCVDCVSAWIRAHFN